MYIVFADKSQRDRELGSRFLSGAGYEVEMSPDWSRCRASLERKMPDVVILDEGLPGVTPLAMVQWIRAIQSTTRPYIILSTTSSVISKPMAMALDAGADDFMRKPFSVEEIVFRVDALKRILNWAPQFLANAKKMRDWSDDNTLLSTNAWTDMQTDLAKDLADMLGCPFSYQEVEHPLERALSAAEIPLVMIEENAQVYLAVGMDSRSLQNIAVNLFGDGNTPQEVLEDMLREIANTLGGALKRAAEADGLSMTTGLPTTIAPSAFGTSSPMGKRQFTLSSPDNAITVALEVELRGHGLQQVKVGELREGMVLTRDLLNVNGTLLVRSGTRLTSSNITRIHQLVPSHLVVGVAA